MKYKNTKTGAIIDSPCNISGGDWQLETVTIEDEVTVEETAEETIKLSEMTVASLIKFASENEINLGKATRKDDIVKAIMESDAIEVE